MDKNVPCGIHRMDDMIGGDNAATQDDLGAWVLAVPLPYYGNLVQRLRAAWWVLTDRAYATQWPEPGDLERALGTYRAPKKSSGKATDKDT